ncbi:hypothetical protein BH24ACT8_BH24ACT8_18200 [soil metagenome]
MQPEPPQVPGYSLLELIGSGATGRVWRARREADALLVALKIVDVPDGDVSSAMREAAVLSRVRHRHLIHLYDVLAIPGADGRSASIALAVQLAGGGSLAQVLSGRGHLTPGELVTVVAPLAGALADLHRAGVVHGDLSPGNVLFLSDGMPMLADLGVCRIAGERVTAVHGTDGMVAPELLEGFGASVESDVYALGALAWTALTGEPPGWVGTREPLGELVAGVPERMLELVDACLAPEPADRPEADEVALALFDAATAEPVELAPGADRASALTHRLRAQARADDESAEDGATKRAGRSGRRGDHRAAGRIGRSLHRGSGPSPGWGSGPPPRRGVRSAIHPRAIRAGRRPAPLVARWAWLPKRWARVATVCVAIVAAAVLLQATAQHGARWLLDRAEGQVSTETVPVDARGSGRPGATPDRSTAPTDTVTPGTGAERNGQGGQPVAESATPTPATSSSATPTSDTRSQDGQPVADPATPDLPDLPDVPDVPDATAILQPVLDARAAAWRSGDPEDLTLAHAAGSAALAQDESELAEAAERGLRYQDLRFTVVQAEVISAEGDVLVVRARVERSAYRVSGGVAGAPTEPAGGTEEVTFELRGTADGWRVWAWS